MSINLVSLSPKALNIMHIRPDSLSNDEPLHGHPVPIVILGHCWIGSFGAPQMDITIVGVNPDKIRQNLKLHWLHINQLQSLYKRLHGCYP